MRSFYEQGGGEAEFYAIFGEDNTDINEMAAYHTQIEEQMIASSKAAAKATGGVSLWEYDLSQLNELADSFYGEPLFC